VAIRFLPLPFPLVNYGAALSGMRPSLFLVTTAIGIAPTVTIYTFFFAALAHAASGERAGLVAQVFVSIALLLSVTLIPQLLAARRRKAKLAALRLQRAARPRRPLWPTPGDPMAPESAPGAAADPLGS
jgi:uncharacterized membrane protein YdjX (TVP38/TMEM64 family)